MEIVRRSMKYVIVALILVVISYVLYLFYKDIMYIRGEVLKNKMNIEEINSTDFNLLGAGENLEEDNEDYDEDEENSEDDENSDEEDYEDYDEEELGQEFSKFIPMASLETIAEEPLEELSPEEVVLVKDEPKALCEFLLKSGKNKGNPCKKSTATGSQFCKIHIGK